MPFCNINAIFKHVDEIFSTCCREIKTNWIYGLQITAWLIKNLQSIDSKIWTQRNPDTTRSGGASLKTWGTQLIDQCLIGHSLLVIFGVVFSLIIDRRNSIYALFNLFHLKIEDRNIAQRWDRNI